VDVGGLLSGGGSNAYIFRAESKTKKGDRKVAQPIPGNMFYVSKINCIEIKKQKTVL
jgi:hypothetical protein